MGAPSTDRRASPRPPPGPGTLLAVPSCDPSDLTALAGRIDRHAEALRTTAHRLGHAVTAVNWDGRAARCFDAAAADLAHGLHGAAGRLDDAAAALRRHAAAVADTLATLHRLAADGGDLLHDSARGAWHALGAQFDPFGVVGGGTGGLVHDGARLGGDLVRVGGDAGHLVGSALHVIGD